MRILVDTPIWSLALRRDRRKLDSSARLLIFELSELIKEGRTVLIGPVRQEVLSGICHQKSFESLREHLRHFDDETLGTEDHEEAARCSNICRASGIVGSSVDFLICAAALRRNVPILTTDRDFHQYSRRLPIRLHCPRG